MKKYFFGIFTAVVAVGIIGISGHKTTFAEAPNYCNAVTTKTMINTCIEADLPVTLGGDITLDGLILIRGDKQVTLDLAGHSIKSNVDFPVFRVRQGSLLLKGAGVVEATSDSNPAIYISGSETETSKNSYLSVGEDVVIKNDNHSALVVDDNAKSAIYGIEVDIQGNLIGKEGIVIDKNLNIIDGAPKINIKDNASVVAENHAIVAEGFADWYVGSANLTGNTGIAFIQGKFYIDGANVAATGNNNAEVYPNGEIVKMPSTGAAIQIQATDSLTDRSEFYIRSGTFSSEKGFTIAEYAANMASEATTVGKFTVHTGTFHGSQDFDNSIVSSTTGAFFWFHGDGCLFEDGSYALESDYGTDYEHTMTVERYADVSGLDAIYADPTYEGLDRLLPVYVPLSSLPDGEVEALASSEFAGSVAIRSFDLSLRMFLDEAADPEPHMSRLFYPVGDTGEEYPVTFKMSFPEIDGVKNGYTREYYVLNFHLVDQRTGEYEIEKLPVEISEDGKAFTFSTHKFSTFALAYEDKKIPEPAQENEEIDVPETGFETNSETLTEKISSSTSSLGLTVAVVAVFSACFVGIKKLQKK